MLTPGQEKYLSTIPDGKFVTIQPYNPLARELGKTLKNKIRAALPNVSVYYIGSSVLGIAGENDIDISVVSADSFSEELESLKVLFGEPTAYKPEKEWVEWKFERDGFPVEIYLNGKLTPLLSEQVRTHKILESSPALKKEYEEIKLSANGSPWKDYMRRKLEFFNKILHGDIST